MWFSLSLIACASVRQWTNMREIRRVSYKASKVYVPYISSPARTRAGSGSEHFLRAHFLASKRWSPDEIEANLSVLPYRQIRSPALPSQRLPLRYRLSLHPERGGGMEASHHDQADPSGYSGSIRRPQPGIACAG